MAESLLDKIAAKAVKANVELRLDSIKWFSRKMRGVDVSSNSLFRSQTTRGAGSRGVGRMVAFKYDPKTKEKLPHYDRFPLVIPIREVPGGFYGLNLHYLSPQSRTAFLGKVSYVC